MPSDVVEVAMPDVLHGELLNKTCHACGDILIAHCCSPRRCNRQTSVVHGPFGPLGTTLKALVKPSGNQAAARRPVQPSAAYQHFEKTPRRAAAEQPLEKKKGAATAPHSRFHVLVLPNHGRCGATDHWPDHHFQESTPVEREGGRSRHTHSRSPTAWIPAHHTRLRDGPAPAHRFNTSPLSSSLLASASGTTLLRSDTEANGPPLPCSGHRSGRLPPPGLSTCGTLPVSGV